MGELKRHEYYISWGQLSLGIWIDIEFKQLSLNFGPCHYEFHWNIK